MSERTSERSGGRERSEQSGASERVSGVSERVSGVSERANGRASGPVLQSLFLFILDHSALIVVGRKTASEDDFAMEARTHRRIHHAQSLRDGQTVVVIQPAWERGGG